MTNKEWEDRFLALADKMVVGHSNPLVTIAGCACYALSRLAHDATRRDRYEQRDALQDIEEARRRATVPE